MHHSTIANQDLRRVSNELDNIRMRLSVGVDGRYFAGSDILGLMEELAVLRDHAKALENEVSCARWNAASQRDLADNQMAAAIEAAQRGDRVVLFPSRARRPAKIIPLDPAELADNDDGKSHEN